VGERVKAPLYGDRVITIVWSRFNSCPRTSSDTWLLSWIRRFTM